MDSDDQDERSDRGEDREPPSYSHDEESTFDSYSDLENTRPRVTNPGNWEYLYTMRTAKESYRDDSTLQLFSLDEMTGKTSLPDISRTRPKDIFTPNENAAAAEQKLFETVIKAAGLHIGESLEPSTVDLSKVPFGSELKEFFTSGDTDSNELTRVQLGLGLKSLAEAFIARSQEIQDRANAYVINKLGYAETKIDGYTSTFLAPLYEDAQVQLLLEPVYDYGTTQPDTAAASKSNDGIAAMKPYDGDDGMFFKPPLPAATKGLVSTPKPPIADTKTPDVPKLFRSASTLPPDKNTHVSSFFVMDAMTRSVVMGFMADDFEGHLLDERFLTSSQKIRLKELFDFFDMNNDNIIAKKDLFEGFSTMAENFIATDHVCQNIANAYLCRKISHAVYSLESLSASYYYPHGLSVAVDGGGFVRNMHSTLSSPTTISVLSSPLGTPSKGGGQQQQFAQTPERPLFAGRSPTSAVGFDTTNYNSTGAAGPFSIQHPVATGTTSTGTKVAVTSAVHPSPLPLPAFSPPTSPLRSIAMMSQDPSAKSPSFNQSALRSSFALKPPSFLPGTIVLFSDAEEIPRKVIIKRYLGGGFYRIDLNGHAILDINEDRLSDPPASRRSSPRPTSSILNDGIMDFRSGDAQSSSYASSTASMVSAHSSRSLMIGGSSLHSEEGTTVEAVEGKLRKLNIQRQQGQALKSLSEETSVTQDSLKDLKSQYKESQQTLSKPPAIEAGDGTEISEQDMPDTGGSSVGVSSSTNDGEGDGKLALLSALRLTLGPSFRLNPRILPRPCFSEPYWLRFGEKKFWFERRDFGQFFDKFLGSDFVPDQHLATACPSAQEKFRCLFIHLGVGIGVHPFPLQLKFRASAKRLLALPDGDLAKALFLEKLESIVNTDSDIDVEVLNAIWPSELHGYRIMVASFEEIGRRGMYSFRSVCTYTPESGPFETDSGTGEQRWVGKDVFLVLRGEHFTLIDPDRETETHWGAYPITDIVDTIKEFNMEKDLHDKVCLLEYSVGAYLQPQQQQQQVEDEAESETAGPSGAAER